MTSKRRARMRVPMLAVVMALAGCTVGVAPASAFIEAIPDPVEGGTPAKTCSYNGKTYKPGQKLRISENTVIECRVEKAGGEAEWVTQYEPKEA